MFNRKSNNNEMESNKISNNNIENILSKKKESLKGINLIIK